MGDDYDGFVEMLGRWGDDLDDSEVSELCFESEVAFDEHLRSPERTPSLAAVELIRFHLTKILHPLLANHQRLLAAWQKLSGVDLTEIVADHRSDEASVAWKNFRAWLATKTFGDTDTRPTVTPRKPRKRKANVPTANQIDRVREVLRDGSSNMPRETILSKLRDRHGRAFRTATLTMILDRLREDGDYTG